MSRLAFAAALIAAGIASGVAAAQDFAPPAPAGPSGDPLALLDGAPPAALAPLALAGAWRGGVAAAGLSQTGDPELGWTALGLVLGGAQRTGGGSIRAVVRRDRAPGATLGPLGNGIGLEAGAAAWVAAGAGIALWASAPQMRVRGLAPPLQRGPEIGGRWRAAGGSLWLTRRAAAPGVGEPPAHELGLSLEAGRCAAWARARDGPLRGGVGLVARAGVVRAAAEVSSHPVLGETVSLMVTLEWRGPVAEAAPPDPASGAQP